MPETTEIIYDVSQAVGELKKLGNEAEKTGKQTERGLIQGGRGLDSLGGRLGGLNRTAGSTLSSLRNLSAAAGPAGVALAGIGTAIAGIVAVAFDLPQIFKDSAKEVQDFIRATDGIRDARDRLSNLQDAAARRDIEERSRDLNLRQASLNEQQIEIQKNEVIAKDRIESAKESFRAIERELQASVNRRKSIEDQLREGEIEARVSEAGAGTTQERSVVNLAAAAENAALEGNLELARALTEEARRRSDELGNHVFFTQRIEQAEQAIRDNLEEQVGQERRRESSLQSKLAESQQEITDLQKQIDALEEQRRSNENERRQIRADRRRLRVERAEQRDIEVFGDSLREGRAALDNLNASVNRSTTGLENFGDAASILLGALTAPVQTQEAVSELGAIKSDLREFLQRTSQTGITPETAREANELRIRALQTIREQRANLGGDFSSGLIDQFVEPIQTGINQLTRLSGATERAVDAGLDRDQSIKDASDNLENASSNLNRAASGIQGRPANRLPQTSQPQQGLNAPAPNQTSSTINVNATVRGGIIDAETTRTITDLIRTEIRKQTTEANIA